jgi:hypothetical protein
MKQTAVQSFWDKIALKLSVEQVNEFLPEFENTKEMEKEQIEDAYWEGIFNGEFLDGQGYYNETFNTKEK